MEDIRLEVSGLYLDPNELTTPAGAMREALNVRIKRANIIEPRPGFPSANAVEGEDSWQLFSWGGAIYGVFGGELWYVPDGAPAEVTAGGASLEMVSSWAFGAPMGRCFYVTTENGVYRIEDPGSSVAVLAGVATGTPALRTAITGAGVPNNEHVAMRTVFAQTVNGQLLLGAPSPPFVYVNTSGSNKGVSLQIPLPAAVIAGMSVQVYRTLVVAVASPTGDEMALAREQVITAGDVTAGYVTVTLLTGGAEELGASLYTNETQEGILQAAYPPPAAKCIAWWKNMAFYGDLGPLDSFALSGVAGASGDAIGDISALISGTATMGSPTITGLTPGHGTQIGTYVTEGGIVSVAGARIPAGARVIGTAATTITLDDNALSTGAVTNAQVLGVLTVDGAEFINGGVGDLPGLQFGSRQDLVALVASYTAVTLDVSDYDAEIYTILWRGNAAFSISYLAQSAGTTLVGLYNTTPTPAVSTSPEAVTSRVAWSKTLQPEAVPLLQYQDVGDWRQPVMRLIPTRDSLFVLKADGVWRITGDSPDTLRFEDFDLSLRLIHRRAADAHDNRVWAWTTLGVVALSEAGAERISEPSIRSAIDAQQQNVATNPDVGGAFITGCGTQGCVLLGVPAADATGDDAVAEYVYVFETNTNAWVRWTIEDVRGAVEHQGTIIGVSGQGDIFFQRADTVDKYYLGVEVASAAEDGSWVELEGDDLPDDLVGFRLTQGGIVAWVTSEDVAIPGRWNVTAALSVGGVDTAAPVQCEVTWCAPATSGALSHWRQLRAQFSSLVQAWRVRFGFTSERVHTESSVYVDFPDPTVEKGVNALRVFVTRACARAARLRPTMRIISAGQRWTLEGITLTFEPMRDGNRLP